MPLEAENREKIRKIASCDVFRDVCKGRRRGVEENIKNGIVVPILEELGWQNQDMDFEHRIAKKGADIFLKHEKTHPLVVECKSIEKKLSRERVQALEYAQKRGAKYTVLTNGLVWELLPTFVEGVPIDRIIPLYTFTLEQIRDSPDVLSNLISKEAISGLDEAVSTGIAILRKRIDEEEFLASLTKFRFKIYTLIREHFDTHYLADEYFTSAVKDWLDKNPGAGNWAWVQAALEDNDFWNLVKSVLHNQGLPDSRSTLARVYGKDGKANKIAVMELRRAGVPIDWVDRLCFEGAYAFINRILFLRMYEDRHPSSAKVTGRLRDILPSDIDKEGIRAAIQLLFAEVKKKFPNLYSLPLYDGINIEQIDWKADILGEILQHTQQHDFAGVNRDLLGDVYQHHTPRPIRKALGQFYTDPGLVEYILDRIADRLSSNEIVIDPACGSGTFLVGAYERLKRTAIKGEISSSDAHKYILEHCLVGIDIDSFAVQLATINLLLRDVTTSAEVRGVVQGNSLTQTLESYVQMRKGTDERLLSLDAILSEIKKRSPKGFKIIIGNPPHHPITQSSLTYRPVLQGYFKPFVEGSVNIATVFLVRWLKLLAPGGVLAFILPKPFIWNASYKRVRDWIGGNFRILEIVDLGKAWDEVGLEQIILFTEALEKGAIPSPNATVRIVSGAEDPDALRFGQYFKHLVRQADLASKPAWRIYASTPDIPGLATIWEEIERGSVPLAEIADIFRGYGRKALQGHTTKRKSSPSQVMMLAGRNIGVDGVSTCWGLTLDQVEWIDPSLLPQQTEEGDKTSNKLARMRRPKIMCKRLVSSDVKVDAVLDDEPGRAPYLSFDTVTNVVVTDKKFRQDYVCGILNSILGTVYLRDIVFARSTLTMDLDSPYLGQIPIRPTTEKNQIRIGTLTRRIQSLTMELAEGRGDKSKARLERGACIDQLDQAVLDAYGVGDKLSIFRALRKVGQTDAEQTRLSEFGSPSAE